jgi:hypothetical protein
MAMGRDRLAAFSLFASSSSAACEYQPLSQTYELDDLADTDEDTMTGLERDAAGLSEAKRDEFEYEKKLVADEPVSETIESDGIHDSLVFPTEEERATLRRVSDHVPWNAYRQWSDTTLRHVLMIFVLSDRRR